MLCSSLLKLIVNDSTSYSKSYIILTRYYVLLVVISKDLKITWGDRSIGIPIERSFPLYLFGKVTVHCIKYRTLVLQAVSGQRSIEM